LSVAIASITKSPTLSANILALPSSSIFISLLFAYNFKLSTPLLSLAVTDTVTYSPQVTSFSLTFKFIVGFVVSIVTFIVLVVVVIFPALSIASAFITKFPTLSANILAVLFSSILTSLSSTYNFKLSTPTLSFAINDTFI